MRMRAMPVILVMMIAASADASRAAPAEACLAGPGAPSPAGKHWYYRVDRASHRKCWYLGALDGRRHRASVARTAPAAARNADTTPAEPAAAAPPMPAPQAAAQAAFGTRWPEAAASTPAAPAPADADRAPATATTTAAPERIATRVVSTERVRLDPAPPKPRESTPPRPAAAPPAAPAEQHSGLPAALLGIALLLAVLGTILVRTRRRMIVRVSEPVPSPDAAAAPDAQRIPPRRSLREILADASSGSPDEAERNPGLPSNPNTRSRIPLRSMRATVSTDIATATLQPAIDPLPPELPGSKSPGIEPAADVEQTLRQLLAAWERRAA
jgi:hypothetical protein